jgi:hypothetical protein
MVFAKGLPPDNFSSENGPDLIISSQERYALREAIRRCPHLSRESLAFLLGGGVTVETINGWSQNEGIQTISRYHAKRMKQIFGKEIFHFDTQILPIETTAWQSPLVGGL